MHTFNKVLCLSVLAVAGMVAWTLPVLALDPYDAPSISCVSAGENEITVKLCAGASGAPAGLTVQWEPKSVFDQVGWLPSDDPGLCALSMSGQPSYQHPGASRWDLGSNACEEITIGDINFDETGVSGTNCGVDPLDCGTDYVFRVFAHAGRHYGRSDWSANVVCSTLDCPVDECTHTQGYWKRTTGQNPVYPDQWPASVLTGGMDLGTVHYTAAQLIDILQTPANSGAPCVVPNPNYNGHNSPTINAPNGLYALAHQLISAKLNVAIGATCSAGAVAIASADALIGNKVVGTGCVSTDDASPLVTSLDQFNNGNLSGCPAHCSLDPIQGPVGDEPGYLPTQTSTWGHLKSLYKQ